MTAVHTEESLALELARVSHALQEAGIQIPLTKIFGKSYVFTSDGHTIIGTIQGLGVSKESKLEFYGSVSTVRGSTVIGFEFCGHYWLARRDTHGGCTGELSILNP